eukprot:CAMPEP_0115002288 /NCGR_PEP_ID=MMETSP0216-20121206/17907_1 /TAXON_ID=223996 /ORGANISM="Protocruzia adherens, Strain Boccale" /LENGTH=50 /DNA_ID=CAMNT_0002367835 /DNA_START=54 /DNA_END=202 /DNA_ORIENTATION=+
MYLKVNLVSLMLRIQGKGDELKAVVGTFGGITKESSKVSTNFVFNILHEG